MHAILTSTLITLGTDSTDNELAVIAICDDEVLVSYKMMTSHGHLTRLCGAQSGLDMRLVFCDERRHAIQRYRAHLKYLSQYRR